MKKIFSILLASVAFGQVAVQGPELQISGTRISHARTDGNIHVPRSFGVPDGYQLTTHGGSGDAYWAAPGGAFVDSARAARKADTANYAVVAGRADSARVSGLSDSAKVLVRYTRITATHDTADSVRAYARARIHDTADVLRDSLARRGTEATGLWYFPAPYISIASPTTFSVAPVRGQVVNTTGSPGLTRVKIVNFAGVSGVTPAALTTAPITYILLDSNGSLVQQPTVPTLADVASNIYLGTVNHPGLTTITSVSVAPDVASRPQDQLNGLWKGIGYINRGVTAYPNGANLSLNISGGDFYGDGIGWVNNAKTPVTTPVGPYTTVSMRLRTRSSTTSASTIYVDPANWDNGGTLTAVGGSINSATNQRIFISPAGQVIVAYGQHVYGSLAAAVAGIGSENFVVDPVTVRNLQLLGTLSVIRTATALNNTAQAIILNASKFGELSAGSAGTATTTMQGAYDNSTPPQILTDATRGALTLKRGSANDTDAVFAVQNGAGTTTAQIKGNGQYTGNAATATRLAASRNIALTGDGYWSVADDGSTSVSGVMTLATVNSNAGTFGSSSQSPVLTVNGKGLVTAASNVTITPAWTSITSKPTTLSGYGITDAQPLDADLTAIAAFTGTGYAKRTATTPTWSTVASIPDADIASAATWNAKAGGSGTTNKVAKWTGSSTLGNGLLTDDGVTVLAAAATDSPLVKAVTTSTSTNSVGVKGVATVGNGVQGTATGNAGVGVLGTASGVGGSGVFAVGAGTADAIYAIAGGSGKAGYFSGPVQITGTTTLASSLTGILKAATGVVSVATVPDFPTLNQNTTGSAAKWTTARNISMTGDVSWTVSVDGSANATAAGTLASILTAGGPVGSASVVPVVTWDSKGRLTAVTTATITPAAIGAQAAGTYLTPTNVSGTAGQVAAFSGANTVAGDAGFTRAQSSGITNFVSVGTSTSGQATYKLSAQSGFAAINTYYIDANLRWSIAALSDANWGHRAYDAAGNPIDYPLTIANAAGGAIALGGGGRPINLTSGSVLQHNGTTVLNSSRALLNLADVSITKGANDNIGVGSFLQLADAASGQTKGWALQLGGSNTLDFWNYASGAWTNRASISTAGVPKFGGLAGTGTRMVTTAADGTLGATSWAYDGPWLPLAGGTVTGYTAFNNDIATQRQFVGNGDIFVRTGTVLQKFGDGNDWANAAVQFPSTSTIQSFRVDGGAQFNSAVNFTAGAVHGASKQIATHLYSTSSTLPALAQGEWCWVVMDQSSGGSAYWTTPSTRSLRYYEGGTTTTQVPSSTTMSVPNNGTAWILYGPAYSGSTQMTLVM